MKNLRSLTEGLSFECLQGSLDVEVSAVICDSRQVEEGALFVCIRGAVADGHIFAVDAAKKGARVLVVEEPVEAAEGITVLQVPDSRYALALISCAWYGHPARKLKTIGVTGTKGKTTTAYMVRSILENVRGEIVSGLSTIRVSV